MKPGAFDRAFARLSVARRTTSHRSSSPHSHSHMDTLLRAYDLLDVTLAHNLPGKIDPDDPSVRETCRAESDSDLDDLVCPLVILVTKLCHADDGARKRMREWVLPDDLDRTSPLEERADLLGRCLRLLGCIHHPRLKDAVGEMLYGICDSDGKTHSDNSLGTIADHFRRHHAGLIRWVRKRRRVPLQQRHPLRPASTSRRLGAAWCTRHDPRRHADQPHHGCRAEEPRPAADDGGGKRAGGRETVCII